MKWCFIGIITCIASAAHCAAETDTETYGTGAVSSSGDASSSSSGMVNVDDKPDAAADAECMAETCCPDCTLIDKRPTDCCAFRCFDGVCKCGPATSGTICDHDGNQGVCDDAQGCVTDGGVVALCGCP